MGKLFKEVSLREVTSQNMTKAQFIKFSYDAGFEARYSGKERKFYVYTRKEI